MFNSYLSENYAILLNNITNITKNKEKGTDILHFTIDYFYQKYPKEKLDKLITSGGMDAYMNKSLYLNCISNTAPYNQSMKKLSKNTSEYTFEEKLDEERLVDEDDVLVQQRYDLIIKLIYSDYVKKKFGSLEHWEYSKKIFLLVFNEGMKLNEIAKRTGISIHTIGYNYRKLKEIIILITKDIDTMKMILPIYNQDIERLIYKNKKEYMDYQTYLEEYKTVLGSHVKYIHLTHAASQKVKYHTDGTERSKMAVYIDIMYHIYTTRGRMITKLIHNHSNRLYVEFTGMANKYNKPGCSSCVEQTIKQLNNILNNYKNLIEN